MTDGPAVATVAGLLVTSAAALAASSETPRLDAEVLLADVLGVDRGRLVIDSQAEVEGEVRERYLELISRRRAGEPVAYLTGRRGFRAIELSVDGRVLIPRPETEELVEAVLTTLPAGASVLDVGTGSGAIALALASERTDLRVAGVEVSEAALAVARENATSLDLDLSLTQGDLLDGAPPVDAVVANLPYVEGDATLPIDVAGFEPALALFGGADGLDVIRRLAAQLTARTWPEWVFLEIGESQGEAVATVLRSAGFGEVEVRADLGGRDRVVVARRGQEAPAR